MNSIYPANHVEELRSLAQRYNFGLEDVCVVPNIQKWCEERGVPENNPFRTGKCLRNRTTGGYVILLPMAITTDMAGSVKDALRLCGFSDDVPILDSDTNFLFHLLLHEVAHSLHEEWGEKECDEWAFEELRKIQSNQSLHPTAFGGG